MDAAIGLLLAIFVAAYIDMALERWLGLRIDRTGMAILSAITLCEAAIVDGLTSRGVASFSGLSQSDSPSGRCWLGGEPNQRTAGIGQLLG